MVVKKLFRTFWAVFLTCVIALNGFVSPVYAANDSLSSFVNGFWQSLGGIVGAATGTVVVCYSVDALIAPFAPPLALYLAPMCGTIGAAAGGISGVKVSSMAIPAN